MSLRCLRALPLLLAGLGVVCAEQRGAGPVPGPARLQRRYSEATLASDYSRAMDRVLRRNFVEWLLARREKKSQGETETPNPDSTEPFRRAAEEEGAPNSLDWLWKNRENQSFPALEGSEGPREFLEQEFLSWLMSGELCRHMTE